MDVEGDGRPHEPLVASLEASLERFPHLREMLGALAPDDDPVRRPQRRRLARRGSRLRAAGQAPRGAGADRGGPGRGGDGPLLPHPDRARGGRRGGGLGAVALHRLQSRLRLQHRDRDLGRAPAPTSATSPPRASSERSWVFGTQRAEVERDANLDWVALGFGSSRGKVRMETRLAGQGSSARVTGAYAGNGTQHLDFDTTQEHAAENTTSDLAFRGVLEESATAVWRGMIRVDPGAQQTDAFQESRNLLLSKSAHADAIPGLEIEAERRPLHPRRRGRPDRRRAAPLPALPRPPRRRGEAPDHRGLPRGAGRAPRAGSRAGRGLGRPGAAPRRDPRRAPGPARLELPRAVGFHVIGEVKSADAQGLPGA